MQLILVGGFLGSGKTTAIREACLELMERGVNVGVITNDQGTQLVDSEYIRGGGIALEEVTGGCFCCQYHDLEQCIQALRGSCRPQVLFAESVGSCMDLVATVVHPLQMFFPSLKITVCVFADASLLLHQLQQAGPFDESIQYIYEHQLEEADVLVVNKADLLGEEALRQLAGLVEAKCPAPVVLYQNSLDRESIRGWMDELQQDRPRVRRKPLSIDYDRYASGEEKLAWLDQRLELVTTGGDAFELGGAFVEELYGTIIRQQWPIGHLKLLLGDGYQQQKISFTQTGRQEGGAVGPAGGHRLEILINARVQTTPELLAQAVAGCVAGFRMRHGCVLAEKQQCAFKPGYPRPVYRMTDSQMEAGL